MAKFKAVIIALFYLLSITGYVSGPQADEVEALSQQLGHSDMSMRLSAIRQLTHFGEPAVPPLD